jgi:hypothetical protein
MTKRIWPSSTRRRETAASRAGSVSSSAAAAQRDVYLSRFGVVNSMSFNAITSAQLEGRHGLAQHESSTSPNRRRRTPMQPSRACEPLPRSFGPAKFLTLCRISTLQNQLEAEPSRARVQGVMSDDGGTASSGWQDPATVARSRPHGSYFNGRSRAPRSSLAAPAHRPVRQTARPAIGYSQDGRSGMVRDSAKSPRQALRRGPVDLLCGGRR